MEFRKNFVGQTLIYWSIPACRRTILCREQETGEPIRLSFPSLAFRAVLYKKYFLHLDVGGVDEPIPEKVTEENSSNIVVYTLPLPNMDAFRVCMGAEFDELFLYKNNMQNIANFIEDYFWSSRFYGFNKQDWQERSKERGWVPNLEYFIGASSSCYRTSYFRFIGMHLFRTNT